jgi:hypothetical protein
MAIMALNLKLPTTLPPSLPQALCGPTFVVSTEPNFIFNKHNGRGASVVSTIGVRGSPELARHLSYAISQYFPSTSTLHLTKTENRLTARKTKHLTRLKWKMY